MTWENTKRWILWAWPDPMYPPPLAGFTVFETMRHVITGVLRHGRLEKAITSVIA